MANNTNHVKLSQVAPWNHSLGNPYRTRYAEHAGRYYRVSATSLHSTWDIDLIDRDGVWLDYVGLTFTLEQARTLIESQ